MRKINQIYKTDVKLVIGFELGVLNSLDPDQNHQNAEPDQG